ncbi:MAG: Creatinine amidohydrolase [Methanosaeta sp. PtaB.Bin039]|nr:MAG: Creatinine amidohydrolase [Methanosaeta sp. PtaB.Bin039]HQF15448.1 creatininase family protein [Methanotrichaceae archaeon]HQI90183.1 creatininase family protein [Methanotrichaceae archaeon]HQJ27848.1 creatininase family protein [Methanotrichaceae archaeon]
MMMEEMTWPEIEAGLARTRTVLLPVGALEEHGPHLPTITDTLQADEVAREVARRRPIFIAPPVHYGVCRSTRGFPGTVSVTFDGLRHYVRDILFSLSECGFEHVLVLAGHAGGQHMAALKEACQDAAAAGLRVSLVTDFDFILSEAVEAADDGHAGEVETSRMLYHRPDLVKGLPAAHHPKRPRYLVLRDVRHLMGNGIMGDPSRASAEKGSHFFQIAVQGVLEVLDELESFPDPPGSGVLRE